MMYTSDIPPPLDNLLAPDLYHCDSGLCTPVVGNTPTGLTYLDSQCNDVCSHTFGCVNGKCTSVHSSFQGHKWVADPTCGGGNKCTSTNGYTCVGGECRPLEITNLPLSLEQNSKRYWNGCRGRCKATLIETPSTTPSERDWGDEGKAFLTKVYFGMPIWVYMLVGFFFLFIILFFTRRRK